MYLQLRITIDPSGNRSYQNVLLLLKAFVRDWVKPQDDTFLSSAGFEQLNKFGERCSPHFHLNVHLVPPELLNPLRSAKEWLRRKALNQDYRLAGNPIWSCTMVEEPDDFDRWIRYPLKETPLFDLCSELTNYETLCHDAHTEQLRSIEINCIKRAKAIDKCSHRDKLFAQLDQFFSAIPDSRPASHKNIWTAILSYYMDQGKSVCYQTINGYTILYQLHIKTLTPDEAYNNAFRSS
jgi:hypothetical protein